MEPTDDLFTVVNLGNDPDTGENPVDQLKDEIDSSRFKNEQECNKSSKSAQREEAKERFFTYGIILLGVVFLLGILISFLVSVSHPTVESDTTQMSVYYSE